MWTWTESIIFVWTVSDESGQADTGESNCKAKKTMKELEMEKANALNCLFCTIKSVGLHVCHNVIEKKVALF